jgi:lipoprotein-anchoring transpeptidase ErfK/SrfK
MNVLELRDIEKTKLCVPMRDFCFRSISVLTLLIAGSAPAFAQSFSIYDDPPRPPGSIPRSVYQRVMQSEPEDIDRSDRMLLDRLIESSTVPEQFRRRVVAYPAPESAGTIVIDTPNTYLYYVLGGGQAIRYGIGVGREGFTWSGVRAIERKTEWPDWIPPAEMIDRQPDLPRWMAGGPSNPLGARAMYLAGSLYRIHGTSQPSSIGQRVSSGCIRMLNEDVIDLFDRVQVGTKVIVLADSSRRVASTPARGQHPRTSREAASTHIDTVAAILDDSEFSPMRLY